MQDQILNTIQDRLIDFDPVAWSEKHLTLDGKPYRLNGNGYKPLVDILRYICIKAPEKNGLPVVIVKSRQTALSTLMSVVEMYCMGSGLFGTEGRPPMRIIHAFPTGDLGRAYSKVKLTAMINNSIPRVGEMKKSQSHMQALLDKSSDTNNSEGFKRFINENHIWIESMGLSGDRIMGKTVDMFLVDEAQKCPKLAISNAIKTLTKAQYGAVGEGVQVYFGTPLQRGSNLWDMWQSSTQQYFNLLCAKCKQYFPLFTPDSNEWENTWIYGFTVRCPKCSHEQDKKQATENGKWIATKDISEAKFIGFHINALFNPDYTKEKIISDKPENNPLNTERTYQTEVLGQFFAGDAGIITPEQIREICGDPERKFSASISQDDNIQTFLGIDIGAKNDLEQLMPDAKRTQQGKSYSTAVVISITGPQRFTIERALKFRRNDLASKKGLIEQLMRQYSCKLGVIDLGFTNDLSEILQTEFGDRFLSSQAVGKVNGHIKYNEDVFPKVITFERDFWISDMYEQMKKGNVRFPLGSYEQVAWLIQHCVNMEISPSMSRTGEITPRFKKCGPNDGFMALLNAYLAYRYCISDGFTIVHPSLMLDKPQKPPVVLGYVPRW